MNVLFVFAITICAFLLASRIHSRYLAKWMGEDPARSTPAIERNDGREYVPTRSHVVFAHHFSAIAGAGPILGFSLAAGHLFHQGLGIPVALGTVFGILLVEGFVITTLDAAVRLNRYLFEELWTILFRKPHPLIRHYWFNSGLSVLLMWLLAFSNLFTALWPIFGTANQLLAALSLLAVSAWLLKRKRKNIFTLIPAS